MRIIVAIKGRKTMFYAANRWDTDIYEAFVYGSDSEAIAALAEINIKPFKHIQIALLSE